MSTALGPSINLAGTCYRPRKQGWSNKQTVPGARHALRNSSSRDVQGQRGHHLAARIDLPVGAVRAFALFAHCFTCTKDILAAKRIAATLAKDGIGVLRFDFTGLGSSEGEFANTDFSSNVEDLVAAASYLRETYSAPAIVIGHSLGGAAVLAAAVEIPEARAVVTIGAPADVAHVLHQLGCSIDDISETAQA